ncbi:MAG: DUF4230 domain-containing protein [Cyclobacteriaceae bacterium]|nr:DUF4230 domain-containing protein [Cyclobacteriaceae bacterium]MCH8516851.1 DUF4230 domain-containing protein [Cyclobacteriaceae bacterium]
MGLKYFFRILPWLLVLLLGVFLYYQKFDLWGTREVEPAVERQTLIFERIERLGKLELSKYHLQEIVEMKSAKLANPLLSMVSKYNLILIAKGEATACVDLSKVSSQDVFETDEKITLILPRPELCYFKLDLQESRLYSFEKGFMTDDRKIIEQAYKIAERKVKEAAEQSDIFDQAEMQAKLFLGQFLQQFTDKTVVIQFETLQTPKEPINWPVK